MVVLVPELRVSVANVLKLEIFMYHSSAHASIYYLSDRVAMHTCMAPACSTDLRDFVSF